MLIAKKNVLWVVSALLAALWVVGLSTGHMLRGFVHALLLAAAVIALIQVIWSKKLLS